MKKYNLCLSLVLLVIVVLFLSCQQSSQNPDDVQIYTVPPQGNQPGTEAQPDSPVMSSPPSNNTEGKYVEHNIVVDERNNIFPIGIPAGNIEETEVTAQGPINFWFEYLPAEAKLEVDGVEVQRDPYKWETKIGYTQSVAKFSYEITNTTGKDISYNLHLIPSTNGESVAVVVRQRWIP